jgi:hypothetical protein
MNLFIIRTKDEIQRKTQKKVSINKPKAQEKTLIRVLNEYNN